MDDRLVTGWRGALKAVRLSLENIITDSGAPANGDNPDTRALWHRSQGAAALRGALLKEIDKLGNEGPNFIEGFLGIATDKNAATPLRLVMLQLVRVVDSLNRDRSFELAQHAQASLLSLQSFADQLAQYGYDDWWITPPEQLDDGWKPIEELPLWKR